MCLVLHVIGNKWEKKQLEAVLVCYCHLTGHNCFSVTEGHQAVKFGSMFVRVHVFNSAAATSGTFNNKTA